ncbi:putative C-type lectin domain family 20 member A [Pungitius pungitius]|uniref:putative C-type lectin domain family 20 member A n=1 Tax=Pungitius pungitius TaxID=134920 RepID=UPI002E161D01
MKICVCGAFLLLLFLCATVAGLGSVVVKHYEYVKHHYTWDEAQKHCRSEFTDLGTIFKKSDEETNLESYAAWVRLYKINGNWVWFDGQTMSSNDDRWEPNATHPSDSCAVVYYGSNKLTGSKCDRYAFFYCYVGHSGGWYTFVPESKTRSEAEAYCNTKHDHLASFDRGQLLGSEVKEQDFPVWTGLRREGGAWKWSYGLSEYRNWPSVEPGDQDVCVAISSKDKKMSAKSCSARFPFVCLSTNLLLVKENKTWEEALDHCRALGAVDKGQYDLVSVQPDDDFVTTVMQQADTEEVWVGLRFLAGSWLWVNGATLLYPDLPLCPPLLQRCGALPKSSGDFVLADCLERRNFLCYRKQ